MANQLSDETTGFERYRQNGYKMRYRILGRRPLDFNAVPVGRNAPVLQPDAFRPLEAVDVEWTHADGPFPDWKILTEERVDPARGELERHEVRVEKPGRPVVKDQINVAIGTPDSVVAMVCEEKRHALARCLGVDP